MTTCRTGCPLTAFGQFGSGYMDTRCMWQDVYWVDVYGVPRFLVDLSPEYVSNVIVFLENCAPAWHVQELQWLSLERSSTWPPPTPARTPQPHCARRPSR